MAYLRVEISRFLAWQRAAGQMPILAAALLSLLLHHVLAFLPHAGHAVELGAVAVGTG